MPIPDFMPEGLLPPGIHAASLKEVLARYGDGTEALGNKVICYS